MAREFFRNAFPMQLRPWDARRAAASSSSRLHAAMSAPGSGTGGQQLDHALMLADGKDTGRADPACDAHEMPIGQWAMAVWERWIGVRPMERMLETARRRFAKVKRRWQVVYGPAAALLLTCDAAAL